MRRSTCKPKRVQPRSKTHIHRLNFRAHSINACSLTYEHLKETLVKSFCTEDFTKSFVSTSQCLWKWEGFRQRMAKRIQLKPTPVAPFSTMIRTILRWCPDSEGKNQTKPIYTDIATSAKSTGGKAGSLCHPELRPGCSPFLNLFKPQSTRKAAKDYKKVDFVRKRWCQLRPRHLELSREKASANLRNR